MTNTTKALAAAAVATLASGLLAACGSSSASGSGSDSPTITITSPADGATVGTDVQVTWDSNVDLGPPDTGRDHAHVFVDGHANDYTVVGGDSFMLKGLSPGKHTIDVTLQHADHSPAGAEDDVQVDVSRTTSTGSSGGSTPSPSDASTPRYGY